MCVTVLRGSAAALKEIIGFGKWIFLGTAFFFFASQADRLILGKLVTFTVLGDVRDRVPDLGYSAFDH